ncbi:hypothetical protein G3I15_46720, partial [Streptomyces sp. SID10244]|nr:hypothetical protein [Streptomyces sp. SID10244]
HMGLADIAAATGHHALFDTLTVYESYPVDADTIADNGQSDDLQITAIRTGDATHYPLNLIAAPARDTSGATADAAASGVSLQLKYLPDAFSEAQIEHLGNAYTQILIALSATDPGRVGDVDLLTPADRDLIEKWSHGHRVDEPADFVGAGLAAQA